MTVPAMTVAEEMLEHIGDRNVPDKRRILRMRFLAGELTRDLRDRDLAHDLVQRLNDAYLVLQMAALANDAVLTDRSRGDCAALVRRIAEVAESRAQSASA